MKKSLKYVVIALFISILISNSCFAKTYELLFWYPGGAGNAEDAKPFLDAFTKYINNKIKSADLKAVYINDEITGTEYIKSNKPPLAIISYPMWLKIKSKYPDAQEWLTCLPLPEEKSTEKYLFISNSKNPVSLYSSFPMSDAFLEIAFPDVPKTVPFRNVPRILGILKKISEGEAYNAILTPDEALSLSSLTADWTKNLIKKESNPVSTAKFILFDNTLSINNKLKDILKQIHKDKSAKNILIDLRLKGFE